MYPPPPASSPLDETTRQFVLHWGEMGTRWGINRTVAQIHALLYLSARPLTAEAIAEQLTVARSNVSTSLRELQTWGVVRPIHVLGDRRTHFESMTDVWEMFRLIVEQRKKREIDPTLEMLRRSVKELAGAEATDAVARDRLKAMLDFFESISGFYDELRHLPGGTLRSVARMPRKVRTLVEFRKKP
jgi:DNA-binding transcriptional regulator GbsR (MarR family)